MTNRALSFDSRADSFFNGHPGYPEELVDEILKYSGFPKGGRMLEIGAGSGQATLPFAKRGIGITAVEPGQNMVDLARPLFAGQTHVDFIVNTFDQWPLEKEAYDLIISARALHWVHPKLRFSKTADALRDQGCLATFRNVQLPGNQPLDLEIQKLIQRYRPMPKIRPATEMEIQFMKTKHFGPVEKKIIQWEVVRDAFSYVEAQKVRLEYHKLPEHQRAELFSAMHQAILGHGGVITQKYETVLFIGRKRKGSSWLQRLLYPRPLKEGQMKDWA